MAAFRERFGRGFDDGYGPGEKDGENGENGDTGRDAFAELLSAYAPADAGAMKDAPAPVAVGKKKK